MVEIEVMDDLELLQDDEVVEVVVNDD